MNRAIDTFKLNITSVKKLDVIYNYLETNNVKTLDLSDLLRSQIVLAVSALDTLVSDVLQIGLVKAFTEGKSLSTNDFSKYKIEIGTLNQIISAQSISDKSLILGEYIRNVNSRTTYQDPKQIVSALRLIGVTDIWRKLAIEMSITNADDIKNELANIAWQRHKIAHESDIDFTTQKKRMRDRETTMEAVKFIENISKAIYIVSVNQLS
jgi:hypothetical protein